MPITRSGRSAGAVTDGRGITNALAYGLSDQIGFAFIGSDSKVHQIFNKAPTEQQLQDALDTLH